MRVGKPRKSKTLEGDTAGMSQPKADAGKERREEDVCVSKEKYSRWNSGEWVERGLDFWCIGVLIPTLNYPLSWAQLGPLVKTPPLFVLRNR